MHTFIVNPHSRSGLGGKVWSRLEGVLKERNVPYQVLFTKYQRHASKLVREITSDGKEHTIVMLGGDGTVNEILNGITDLTKVTLGYIPIGSSNDFARYFKHSADPVQALETILDPKSYAMMNVGLLAYKDGEQRKRFAVSTGIGFDAGVCHQAAVSKLKILLNRFHLGKLTYVGIALSQMMALKPCKISIRLDGGKTTSYERAYFAAAMNHPYEGGGFMFCPKADPCDDLLDVTVIAGVSKLKALCLLPTAFKGWHTAVKGVYTYTCRQAVIESERAIAVHTDGEPVLLQREIQVKLEPWRVRIITG